MPFSHDDPQVKHPSLEGLIAWLETQETGTRYSYFDCRNCLLARYARSFGIEAPYVTTGAITEGEHPENGGRTYLLPGASRWDGKGSPLDRISETHPHTFGAALTRAYGLLPETADA